MKRAAVIAVFGLLVPASTAAAAPPWSAPEDVSPPATFVGAPQVVFDNEGRAYASWSSISAGSSGQRIAVREPGANDFGPERAAPRFVTPLVSHGFGRVLGLEHFPTGHGRISLRARCSRPDGSFGRPDTIATNVRAGGPPSLAVHGIALVAWSEGARRGRRIVRVAIRRFGQRSFRSPVTLRARGRARHVVAAAGPGVTFVAWERAGVVEARVRRVGRGGWGPVRRLGPASKGATRFRASFAGRRGYLAWLSPHGADSAVLRAAVLPVAGTRFRPAQTVDTIDRSLLGEDESPALVPAGSYTAVLAWTDWDGSAWRVRAAATGASPSFESVVDVSPPEEQAVVSHAAAGTTAGPDPRPAVMVVWSRLDPVGELGDRVRSALRPPGGPFGAPEDVSDLDRARLGHGAFDPQAQRWTAVWSQRIGPDQGVPLAQITTYLRSATRPGGTL
jgi:hypothetical protein